MIVKRTQLAEIIGCSATKVLSMVKRGAPFISQPRSQGGEWQFETADVIKWMTDQTMSGDEQARLLKEAKVRERVAVADLRVMERDEKLKRLVRVEDVIPYVEAGDAIVKSRPQAIPGRMAQALSVESDAAKVLAMLKVEVNEALDEISKHWTERG